MSDYPEHDKMSAIVEESQAIGQWLEATPYTLCTYDMERLEYQPVNMSIEKVLAEHFGIDLDKVEAEKRAMLDEIRRAQS